MKSIFNLIYFYRGAIQYGDAMWMSAYERLNARDYIEDHLKKELKKSNPNY
jgi:hypothetical protein